jgi:glucokinase
MTVIAGDIGGTRSRLAIFDGDHRTHERTYSSRDFDGLASVVARFLSETGARPTRGCFAIAGPVHRGVCRTTNLPWVVDERAIAASAGLASARLVNDFAAQTAGVTLLREGEYAPLLDGEPDEDAPVAVLGAGTGLGEAFALRHRGRVERVLPGEGGHADFAPTDERQITVLRELRALLGGRVSYEHVLSGPGLYNIYRALARTGQGAENEEVTHEIKSGGDPSAVISRLALAGDDGLCGASLEVFVEVYAQEASNMALRGLALGGVFLAGGIAPRILPALRAPRFTERFRDKPPHGALLSRIPVRVVLDTQLGLRGAALLADDAPSQPV